MPGLAAQLLQVRMRQRDGLLHLAIRFVLEDELHVHCVGMTDRNRGLQPLEIHLEFAAEGVGTCFKLAEIAHRYAYFTMGCARSRTHRAAPIPTGATTHCRPRSQ